jgi:hypothetical protein
MKKLNSIEALEFWEGDYNRDANTVFEPAMEIFNSFGRGNKSKQQKAQK